MNSLHNENMKLSFPSQGEAFGEDSMAIAQDFLPECFATTECMFWLFCQTILLNRLSSPDALAPTPYFLWLCLCLRLMSQLH